ncbi:MAG: 16S rRNA (cytosine(1402)-N(4))-methyltransferase RsmH [Dehalococcoidia bacterium]
MNSKYEVATHLPVMLSEVLEAFNDSPEGWFIDGTFGLGGHSRGLLERYPERKVFGIDLDGDSTGMSRIGFQKFADRVLLVNGNYADMKALTRESNISSVGGILLDLGLSSMQLETEGRGFSFRKDEILDMRYNQSQGITALDLINTSEEKDLSDIFFQFGEERAARRIAKEICTQRPIMTTGKLAKIVERKVGRSRKSRIHPATKIFQALRIAVNQEFENINRGLSAGLDLLANEGKFVVLTYHSLEDRIVKQFFKKESLNCICPVNVPVCICDHKSRLRIVNKKVKTPSISEIDINPRSRSAKMRIVEKIV